MRADSLPPLDRLLEVAGRHARVVLLVLAAVVVLRQVLLGVGV